MFLRIYSVFILCLFYHRVTCLRPFIWPYLLRRRLEIKSAVENSTKPPKGFEWEKFPRLIYHLDSQLVKKPFSIFYYMRPETKSVLNPTFLLKMLQHVHEFDRRVIFHSYKSCLQAVVCTCIQLQIYFYIFTRTTNWNQENSKPHY